MSDYSVTKARILQYVGIVLIMGVFAGAYWYFQVFAGVKTNVSPTGAVTSGLVGYWTFDGADTTSTTATDRGSGGNNGTLTNGPIAAQGKVGQALEFDGTDDRVAIASSGAALNLTTTLTYSAWIYPQTFGGGSLGRIVDKNTGESGAFFVDNANITSGLGFIGSGGSLLASSQSNAIALNTWQHVVVTFSSGTVNFYVNGILSKSTATAITLTSNTGAFAIGERSSGAANRGFDGLLDEVRVYNTALTAAEIQSLYKLGESDKMNVSDINGNLNSGLAGYWPLDNGSGTSATDASTNGNTGTLTNGPTWTTGQIGNAVSLDGTNDYVDIGRAAITSTSALTLAVWAKFPTGGETQYLFGNVNGQSGSDGQAFMVDNSGTQNIYGMAGVIATTTNAITPNLNTWYHFVNTFDGTTERLYVDGVLIKSGSGTLTQASENNVMLGRHTTGGGTFYGNITFDEARVYTRALASDEVAQLYRYTGPASADSGLVGYWSFNGTDTTSTTAYDRSGSGNTGTFSGSTASSPGKIGQAMTFSGSSSQMATSLTQTGQTYTFSTWAKLSTAATGYFFDTSTGRLTLSFGFNAPLARSLSFYDGNWKSIGATNSIPLNEWVHLVWVFDSSNSTAYGYINGVLQGTAAYTGKNISASTRIGNHFNAGDAPMVGTLDEVRIYNRALSASEIQAQYAAGQSDEVNTGASQAQGTGRLDSGLAGYWKLDDGSGTSATDSSTNGNTGTLTNGPTWGTGQVGGDVDLDGTNDYVTMGDQSAHEGMASMTLSGWIKMDALPASNYMPISKSVSFGQYRLQIDSSGIPTFVVATTNNAWFSSGTVASGSTALTTSTWIHLLGTYDGQFVRIYVNGVLAGTGSQAISGAIVSNTAEFRLGYDTYGNYFNGQIDEVRLYNRSLSADEVSQLYRLNAPTGTDTGLKGYWSFNGKDVSGTTAYDRSGAGNTGTLTNGPTVTPGKLGQALDLDGTDDFVSVPDVLDKLDMFDTEDLTLSLWFNRDTFVTDDALLGKRDSTSTVQSGYITYIDDATDKVTFEVSDGTDEYQLESSSTFTSTGWHHVAVVFDEDNATNCEIYIDGVANGATKTGTLGNIGAGVQNSPFTVGRNGSAGNPFDGKLDEARMYKRTLTAAEIYSLYNASK